MAAHEQCRRRARNQSQRKRLVQINNRSHLGPIRCDAIRSVASFASAQSDAQPIRIASTKTLNLCLATRTTAPEFGLQPLDDGLSGDDDGDGARQSRVARAPTPMTPATRPPNSARSASQMDSTRVVAVSGQRVELRCPLANELLAASGATAPDAPRRYSIVWRKGEYALARSLARCAHCTCAGAMGACTGSCAPAARKLTEAPITKTAANWTK